ncbi:Stp1/IreP family PP2C-type Ser/Thr phosphatase [Clostridium polynesiense]|uniref:Stp1/IreP family PP2C-type Ser/Thr phosphatase n=1 Tax=Clostridium polynesiense TaxID=1325933 RepID=UPI00058F8AEF|nr:Stp1/IreP family PP2C-type Ser/Thr phosphatase [Clostridium polynesiense]
MVGLLTDIGNVRSLNEDYIDYEINDKYKLFVIADGMGGHNAGEIASKMAVETILKFIKDNIDKYNIEEILVKSFKEANKEVHEYSCKIEDCNGMGTTVTACFISKDILHIANVGDSGCYLVDSTGITKITRDHSLVQELLDEGSITEEQALHHPNKNYITRSVGIYKELEVDLYDLSKREYEYIILCTDGLSNEVDKEEIYHIVKSSSNVKESCEKLIDLAKQRGGRDNISVVIVGGED